MLFADLYATFSENPYLIWEVITLFLHVFSRPEGFCCFNESDFSEIISCHTLQNIGSKPFRSNRVSH